VAQNLYTSLWGNAVPVRLREPRSRTSTLRRALQPPELVAVLAIAPPFDSIDEDTRPSSCLLNAIAARFVEPLSNVLRAGLPLRPFSHESCTASSILSQYRGKGVRVNGFTLNFTRWRASCPGQVDGLRHLKQSLPQSAAADEGLEYGKEGGLPVLASFLAMTEVTNGGPCTTPDKSLADNVIFAGSPRRAAPRRWLTSNNSILSIMAARSALVTPASPPGLPLETRALRKRRCPSRCSGSERGAKARRMGLIAADSGSFGVDSKAWEEPAGHACASCRKALLVEGVAASHRDGEVAAPLVMIDAPSAVSTTARGDTGRFSVGLKSAERTGSHRRHRVRTA